MVIQNKKFANQKLSTGFGFVVFDEQGKAEIENEHGNKLLRLKGFTKIEVSDEETNSELSNTATTDTEDDSTIEVSDEEKESKLNSLNSLNVAQLKKYAREHDIELGDASKKQEILDIIEKFI